MRFFFFLGSSVGSLRLGLGHLAALVGGLGRPLVGAGTAVTCLANNRGTLGVSATVSVTMVGAEVEGCTSGPGSSIFFCSYFHRFLSGNGSWGVIP